MKNNITKFICIALIVIILLIVSASTYFNSNLTLQYFCAVYKKIFTIKFIYIAWTYMFLGMITGYLVNQITKSKMLQINNAYQKRHETTSIEKDSDKARIKTLEAKIATLETALESALKKD